MVIHSQYAYILKGNAFGKGEKNAEKMRKLRWKEELIHMMDADGDGEVQPDEVLEFLTNHEKLKNDPTIQPPRKENNSHQLHNESLQPFTNYW